MDGIAREVYVADTKHLACRGGMEVALNDDRAALRLLAKCPDQTLMLGEPAVLPAGFRFVEDDVALRTQEVRIPIAKLAGCISEGKRRNVHELLGILSQ